MSDWKLAWRGLEFEPRDCWIGVYWNHPERDLSVHPEEFDVWICLVPMIPLHLHFHKRTD